jgi:hypothetical protein
LTRHAIIAAGLGAAALTIGITTTGGAQGQGNDTTTVYYEKAGRDITKFVDARPFSKLSHGFPKVWSPGDQFLTRSPLYSDAAGTTKVGRVVARCVDTVKSKRFDRLLFLCDGSTTLADGQVTFSGVWDTAKGDTFQFAITGGTGAYEGAAGQITIANQPNDDSVDTVHLLNK